MRKNKRDYNEYLGCVNWIKKRKMNIEEYLKRFMFRRPYHVELTIGGDVTAIEEEFIGNPSILLPRIIADGLCNVKFTEFDDHDVYTKDDYYLVRFLCACVKYRNNLFGSGNRNPLYL